MMKKLLFLTICLLLIVTVGANAQWKFVKYFPDTVKYPNKQWPSGINNGLAIDPDGKIWIQSYAGAVDSILDGTGKMKACGVIQVFYPNGTPASFSPIKYLSGKDVPSGATVADTLGGSGYGLSVDPSTGNILSVKTSARLWKIDYKTGKGILRILNPIPGYTSSLDAVGVDNYGEVFCGPVVPGSAIGILNPDFTAAGTVTTSTAGYSRAVAVSGDGNDVYFSIFGNAKTHVFHSDNGSLGPYVLKDSIMAGTIPETMVWGPKTKYLWTTSGNATSGYPTIAMSGYMWVAWDLTKKKFVDGIKWYDPQIPMYGNDQRPRGIAFNKNEDTAYVACFNSNVTPPSSYVQVFAKTGATAVEPVSGVIATSYTLSQNYPNPFNPSTEIRFTLAQAGQTTLKVYDVMGREVATLVDQSMNPGAYNVKFDASHLSSGTYMYVLTSGSTRLTGKMMLLK